jgi:predicted Rdx family selenoprotein
LAAAIHDAQGVVARLIAGKGGIFDVVVDDKRIYCKAETGRFPTNQEILDRLESF